MLIKDLAALIVGQELERLLGGLQRCLSSELLIDFRQGNARHVYILLKIVLFEIAVV